MNSCTQTVLVQLPSCCGSFTLYVLPIKRLRDQRYARVDFGPTTLLKVLMQVHSAKASSTMNPMLGLDMSIVRGRTVGARLRLLPA